MAKVVVRNLAISLDGYVAGPNQSLDAPIGERGHDLHEWVFATRSWHERVGESGGSAGLDNDFLLASDVGVGATIMGRNMFGPQRGAWPDDGWQGWWGDEPPYHHATFVLTHYPRPSMPMQGGTTFHFVDDRIEAVLERAMEAAGGQDVKIAGGASTVRQYLAAGLIDELHLAITPVLLGTGERLFGDLAHLPERYHVVEHICSPAVMHVRIARR
jgi:dihydrofolate reductase